MFLPLRISHCHPLFHATVTHTWLLVEPQIAAQLPRLLNAWRLSHSKLLPLSRNSEPRAATAFSSGPALRPAPLLPALLAMPCLVTASLATRVSFQHFIFIGAQFEGGFIRCGSFSLYISFSLSSMIFYLFLHSQLCLPDGEHQQQNEDSVQ